MSEIIATEKYEQLLSTISSILPRVSNMCDSVAPIELVTYRRAFED